MLSIHIFTQKRQCVRTLAMQSFLGQRPQGAGEPPLTVDCLKWQWEGFWPDSLLWKVKGAHSSNFKSMQSTFHWGCFISADVSLGATPTAAFWPEVIGTWTSVLHTFTWPGQGDSVSCADDSGFWTTRAGSWCRVDKGMFLIQWAEENVRRKQLISRCCWEERAWASSLLPWLLCTTWL